jgi:maleate cis-trans isomerase
LTGGTTKVRRMKAKKLTEENLFDMEQVANGIDIF